MTSNRPYLIRAIYEWIVDNHLTPYIVIDAGYEGAQVPLEYVEEGKIVLNISPEACRGLHLENDRIVFTAKFAGDAIQVFVPPLAVLALYSKENGRGMFFTEEETTAPTPPGIKIAPSSSVFTKSNRMNKSSLTLVKQ